jgi:hypothetical protein
MTRGDWQNTVLKGMGKTRLYCQALGWQTTSKVIIVGCNKDAKANRRNTSLGKMWDG